MNYDSDFEILVKNKSFDTESRIDDKATIFFTDVLERENSINQEKIKTKGLEQENNYSENQTKKIIF